VKVKKVYEVEINDLHARGRSQRLSPRSIDPTTQGYTLTGDQNIIQVDLVARFQVDDPVAFALQQSEPEAVLRSSVMAAAVRTMGELEVDDVLSEGRAQFIVTVVQRAQERLRNAKVGIDLVSIEVTDLSPPEQVQEDFEEVQNAFIDMRTKVTEAKRQREQNLPRAQAERDQELRDAEVFATELLARAKGDTAAWRDLYTEYRASPTVLRQRLYLESIEQALPAVSSLRFVPPPEGRRYPAESFRISISPRD
jgi:membrane protease subunit HflK